ncbi:hypothetical protein GGX14DRAFT_574715 [Mycena pura]|uniref:Retrotransposon gag domain-containing protein n=1 Tax=Mycena pura TaxID=153505 RepID=A0AAD6UWL5_9AGAR|nr:hypothetical protein GGX14DRAFT_574715 [Mycena pura]
MDADLLDMALHGTNQEGEPAGDQVPPVAQAAEPELDTATLARSVLALGESAKINQSVLRAFGHGMESLIEKVEALTISAGPKGAPHFNPPRQFNGKKDDVEPFLSEINHAVHLSRASLRTDYDYALFMSGYLKDGSPKSWFYAVEKQSEHLLHSWEKLQENFREHFGDPDPEGTAWNKIQRLKL